MAELTAGLTHALEPRYYTDPEIHARERERIFFRTWQFLCHQSEIAGHGDYRVFDIFGQSLFLIRDRDGTVRCFYNVCAHRAHELLSGKGRIRRVVCPYHAWTYTLDGTLMRAPASENVPDFDASAVCLTAVRAELFCGFVFVNFDDDAVPMEQGFPGVAEQLREFVPQIDDLKIYRTVAVEEACNWKVSVENYSECYHCALNHPTFSNGVIDSEAYNISPQGRHVLQHTTVAANPDHMTYRIDTGMPHADKYNSWFLWPSVSFQVYPGHVLNTYRFVPTGVDTVTVERGLRSRGYKPGPLVIDPAGGVNSEHSIRTLGTWVLEALGETVGPSAS